MSLRFAYNTNGTANHRLDDALGLIADSGYDGVALTLDIHHLDPFAPEFPARLKSLAARLRTLGLGCVVETGARFLLDPRAKHEPTLVTPDADGRARRVAFLEQALQVVAETNGEAMSFWAGVPKPEVSKSQAAAWLRQGIEQVVGIAARLGVTAALEPEPGMLIETADEYRRLGIPGLKLALDTGHCIVTGERDPAESVVMFAEDLGTVAIEDMQRGVHVHLPFGEGDMNVAAVLKALEDVGYGKLVCVELSRDSHRADMMVPKALAYLRQAMGHAAS